MSDIYAVIKNIDNPQEFTKFCNALLKKEYADFQVIDDTVSDEGNDGYLYGSRTLYAMHCFKKEHKTRDRKAILAKAYSDLAKAKKLKDSGKYVIERWIFLTPYEIDIHVLDDIRSRATELGIEARQE